MVWDYSSSHTQHTHMNIQSLAFLMEKGEVHIGPQKLCSNIKGKSDGSKEQKNSYGKL
jgi:hypothetical protein